MIEFNLADEAATLAFGAHFATICPSPAIVFLQGNLGAGKTTFVRGFLQGLGYYDKVKSPTYTLVEPYEINGQQIFHFDLYRVTNPAELENIGLHDYLATPAIILIEWPERGGNLLPTPNISIELNVAEKSRNIKIKADNELVLSCQRRLASSETK